MNAVQPNGRHIYIKGDVDHTYLVDRVIFDEGTTTLYLDTDLVLLAGPWKENGSGAQVIMAAENFIVLDRIVGNVVPGMRIWLSKEGYIDFYDPTLNIPGQTLIRISTTEYTKVKLDIEAKVAMSGNTVSVSDLLIKGDAGLLTGGNFDSIRKCIEDEYRNYRHDLMCASNGIVIRNTSTRCYNEIYSMKIGDKKCRSFAIVDDGYSIDFMEQESDEEYGVVMKAEYVEATNSFCLLIDGLFYYFDEQMRLFDVTV